MIVGFVIVMLGLTIIGASAIGAHQKDDDEE